MPPRRGIVKSGNAGNSSKASTPTPSTSGPGGTTQGGDEKPLFPAGFKTPLALLHERCQKLGWDKPIVAPRNNREGFTCVVTLSQARSSNKETVVMQPHPPLSLPTALEAKHWGATYALYRFSNNLQLHRLLPPGPREYWDQLEKEHKTCPDHLKWQYEPDPFAAKRAVEQRQEAASWKKIAEGANSSTGDLRRHSGSKEYEKAPEVRMASSMRDKVEDVIKEMASRFPGVVGDESAAQFDVTAATTQLRTLGFAPHQIQRAITFLSTSSQNSSPYLASLLALSPLEGCISFLLLHIPESDLPPQFLKEQNSSDPFIRGGSSGTTTLAVRWLVDKSVKEGGWPSKVVTEIIEGSGADWSALTECLNCRLIGMDAPDLDLIHELSSESEDRDAKRIEEIDAVISVYPTALFDPNNYTLSIPLQNAPDTILHIILAPSHPYPGTGSRHPPMYISSSKLPPYIRLHILLRILTSLRPGGDLHQLLEAGEGIIFGAVDCADSELAAAQNAPPEVGDVMRYLLPKRRFSDSGKSGHAAAGGSSKTSRPKRSGRDNADDRSDDEIRVALVASRETLAYASILDARSKLPAWSARDNIVHLVQDSRVVIVVGETGCGKTTQLPQFILDSCILSSRGASTNIIVTQPRRVSALSVAARVSSERLDDGSVGYAIRGESKQTRRTKLLFCTTGVLLRRMTMSNSDGLAGVSHVIVDEVHERSVDGDFLLLELRELLKTNATVKVILMSATINQQVFVGYFGGAPVLEIPGFTHPVKDIYLEDVISHINYIPPSIRGGPRQTEEQQRSFREMYQSQGLDQTAVRAIEKLARTDRIDYQLVAEVVMHIIKGTTNPKGAILIFLPGVQEIRQCMDTLRTSSIGGQVEIFPLHANLSSDEQRRVFTATKLRKIVVATNVAETSITIPDVIYVVDSGKVKETQYDAEAGLSRLVETWVTRAAARQRRGRAGRTRPGECYKLFTRKQEEKMEQFPVPEILRVPLESLSLQIKAMREDENVTLFLSKAIDPPKVQAMEKAWSVLEELGAIDWEGRLTALGRQMSLLPVDLRLAKMMILGAIFRCLDATLTIAACVASKPLFVSPVDKRDEANKARERFAMANSDLLTDMNAYNRCRQMRVDGMTQHAQRTFMEENFISATTVRDITSLRGDFLSALSDIGFVPLSATADSPSLNINSDNSNLIKAVILGGLWPRVARIALPKATFDRVAAGTVQREHVAKEFKIFDKDEGRVFLHPSSVLFGISSYKSPFIAYFSMNVTSKTFLRDATEVPLYSLLLFGGRVTIDHIKGGVTVGQKGWIKMKAWSRIGVLVNQLRLLLDAQLQNSIEQAQMADLGEHNPVVQAMLDLISHDGLSGE